MADACVGDQGGQAGADQVLEIDLEALFEDEPEGGFTVREIARRMGKTVSQVRYRLRPLVEEGKVQFVGKRPEPNVMDGKMSQVPVYQWRES